MHGVRGVHSVHGVHGEHDEAHDNSNEGKNGGVDDERPKLPPPIPADDDDVFVDDGDDDEEPPSPMPRTEQTLTLPPPPSPRDTGTRMIDNGGEIYNSALGYSSSSSSSGSDGSGGVMPPRPAPPPPPPVSVSSSDASGERVLRLLEVAVRNGTLASPYAAGQGITCPCSKTIKPLLRNALEVVARLAGEAPLTAAEATLLRRSPCCKSRYEQFCNVGALEVGWD